MSDVPHVSRAAQLPWEPDSTADILAASHIFVVTVLSAASAPWMEQSDGLEHRGLQLRLRLDAALKGRLGLAAAGTEFSLAVVQAREPGGVVSDYPGVWSSLDPGVGAAYLVLSTGPGEDPPSLMQEPALRLLAPAETRADVEMASAAEARIASLLADPSTRERALLGLLETAHQHRQTMGHLAASYVLARVSSGELRDGPLATAILVTVLAPDTSTMLRTTLAAGLCNAALDQGASPEQRTRLARGLFALADVNPAAALFERLLTAELYNLVFEIDAPALRASDVVPDVAARARLGASLAQFDDERIDEIAAWLRGP